MICPVCGNNSPDSMRECQFCSTPLTPTAPAAPTASINPPGMAQYNTAARPQVPMQQRPYAPQQALPQQRPYGNIPQAPYSAQPTQLSGQQNPYAMNQPQYTAAAPAYNNAQQQYAPVQNNEAFSEPNVSTENISDQLSEEEIIEEEKKVNKGTLTALLIWFLFVAAAIALIYFDVPSMVTELFDFNRQNVSATDSVESEDITDSDNPTENGEPVMDALYGTWVLCTYYVQDLSTSNVSGGQHYTHSVPLQFYTFNCGTLDRFSGSSAAFLSHETVSYTYNNSIFKGTLLSGGSAEPSVVLDESYLFIYDTCEINGVPSRVEYALLRVFDSPASDDAIIVYAEAIENGTVSLPQYTSSLLNDPSVNSQILTTAAPTATSQISTTYGVIGTWLLTSRTVTAYDANGQKVGNPAEYSISGGSMAYNYVVFKMDGRYVLYTLKFSDDMTECLEKDSSKGSYEFNDGLLSFKPASSKTSVTASSDSLFLEYTVSTDNGTEHYKDTYIHISSDEYGYDELIPLRPDVN